MRFPILLILFLFFFCSTGFSFAHSEMEASEITIATADGSHSFPAVWSVAPFVLLLLLIAAGPLFFPHLWHKFYPHLSVMLGVVVLLYYLIGLHNTHTPIHAVAEYIQFISLLTGLFVVSGGIVIQADYKSLSLTNVKLLTMGAILANIIGTTGASMLLIRPFIRLNKKRVRPYHIVFFIFIVSNVGGSLTPIGDPPLFLGFLKGVPFSWTLINNFLPWIVGVIYLLAVFYFYDIKSIQKNNYELEKEESKGTFSIKGSRNFLWLLVIIISVFIDPNVFSWVPGIEIHGQKISFIREIIMLATAFLAYKSTAPEILKSNEFEFEPIREVAFLFVGLFLTMMPALELVSKFAESPEGSSLISISTLYWGTGSMSGFLDNAPTYLNFLAASMASVGADIKNVGDVIAFSNNEYQDSAMYLMAISIGAVFFGAFSYIGNGPNFMVKSIAEQVGIGMPSFFEYIFKYSLIILMPMLVIVWLIFFS